MLGFICDLSRSSRHLNASKMVQKYTLPLCGDKFSRRQRLGPQKRLNGSTPNAIVTASAVRALVEPL
jgi:hypothetical protein